MTDEIVNELLSNIDTQKIMIDQLRQENERLQSENILLKQKNEQLT